MTDLPLADLESIFSGRLQTNVSLARYTAARVGGPADAFLVVENWQELEDAVHGLWMLDVPFLVLGGGSNVLVADAGVRCVVVLNRARRVEFSQDRVWAESGANLGSVARQAAASGLTGIEWAAGIPGTVGGAVVGNAGAHGGDMAGTLMVATILHLPESDIEPYQLTKTDWPVEQLEYTYRSSRIKRQPGPIVLSATLKLQPADPELVTRTMDEYSAHRRRTQPPGASMGSMFKNPPGDYAGRLIEAAGLKGTRVGAAEISQLHANFFVNQGGARAVDIYSLMKAAQEKVADMFGVRLEPEIQMIGDWEL